MRTQAIILKKIPVREHDELIVCYTNTAGKQRFQAKGILRAHSKQSRHVDIFNHIECNLIESKNSPIMASAACIRAHRHLKSDLTSLAAAYFIVECFDKLVYDGEVDERLWNFLSDSLDRCDAGIVNSRAFVQERHQTLLELMGYHAEMPLDEIMHGSFNSLTFLRAVEDSRDARDVQSYVQPQGRVIESSTYSHV